MSSSRTNTMALVSLIAGIASWVVAPVAASIVAVICGHVARKQIRSTGEDGDGMAVLGLVLGYVNLIGACVGTALAFLIFGAAITAMLGLGGAAALQGAH